MYTSTALWAISIFEIPGEGSMRAPSPTVSISEKASSNAVVNDAGSNPHGQHRCVMRPNRTDTTFTRALR